MKTTFKIPVYTVRDCPIMGRKTVVHKPVEIETGKSNSSKKKRKRDGK